MAGVRKCGGTRARLRLRECAYGCRRVLVRARDGRSRIHSDHHADAPDCGKAEGAHAAPGVLGRADDPAAALDDQPGADALRHALRNE